MPQRIRTMEDAIDRLLAPSKVRLTPALGTAASSKLLAQPDNAVQPLGSALGSRLDQAILLDPQIAIQIGQLATPASAGVPRSQIGAPICPAADVTDQVLFEGAANPAQKFFLPRYRIATQLVSGRQQYRLALEAHGAGWQLVAFLEKFPAPELGPAGQGAAELAHEIAVLLRYQLAGSGGAQKELAFDEVAQAPGGMRVALTVASIAERDELYRAMTIEEYHAALVVRRALRVAVPTNRPTGSMTLGMSDMLSTIAFPAATSAFQPGLAANRAATQALRAAGDPDFDPTLPRPFPRPRPLPTPLPVPPPLTPLPRPALVLKGTEDYQAGDKWWTRYQLSVSNWNQFSDELFAPSPDLPPCGANTNAARTWVDILHQSGARLYGFCALGAARDLDGLWFAVEAGQDPPPAVYVTLIDRRTGRSVSSDPVALPIIPRFRELNAVLDSTISPFLFPPALHGYVFSNVTPQTGPTAGLLRWQIAWQGGFYSYYQEQARPYLFYYLPDQFKLARRPDGMRPPWMSARLTTSDGFRTEATTQVTFSYVVAPFVDADRLAAALPELLSKMSPADGRAPQLEPLITDSARFFTARPLAVGAVTEERHTASVALRSAIHDTLIMSLNDFQPLYEALVEPSASLFGGKLVVELQGWPAEEIPFSARLDDMVGGLLTYAAVPQPDLSGLRVTLTNAIESTLRIESLKAALSRGAAPAPAELRELALPAELAPGTSISFVVAPAAAVAGSGELIALFDLDGVRAIPDAAAIWEAIVESDSSEYFRNVTVKAVAALFTPPDGRPDEQIEAIVITFEGGETVELTASLLEAVARVDLPIKAVMTGQGTPDSYSYRVTTIRKNGQQQTQAPAPRRDKLFYVDVTK